MEVRQVVLAWTLPSGTASRTVLNCNTVSSMATQINDIRTALEAFKANLGATVAVTYPTVAKVYDVATGAYLRDDTAGAVANTVGTGSTAGPDANQGLIVFPTGSIIRNRRLKGRMFVPGIPASLALAGNPSSALVTALGTLGNALANAGVQVWHKPRSGSGGVMAPITTVFGSPEFAVLRRRRNRIVV